MHNRAFSPWNPTSTLHTIQTSQRIINIPIQNAINEPYRKQHITQQPSHIG